MDQQTMKQGQNMRNDPSDPFGKRGLQITVAQADETPGAQARLPKLDGYDFSTLNSLSSSSTSNISEDSCHKYHNYGAERDKMALSEATTPSPTHNGFDQSADFSIIYGPGSARGRDMTQQPIAPHLSLDCIASPEVPRRAGVGLPNSHPHHQKGNLEKFNHPHSGMRHSPSSVQDPSVNSLSTATAVPRARLEEIRQQQHAIKQAHWH
jgi:hypothetical protein